MPPAYRYPPGLVLSILASAVSGARRSFRRDALRLTAGLPLDRIGIPPASAAGTLFLVNHYSRPGFQAWWVPLAVAACLSEEMHWTMTSAWTYADPLRARLVTPLTEWLLARLARMYGFTLMPPMPPRPQDAARRAAAVRVVLRVARESRPPIGLAPEGMDSPDGRLMRPPAGVGRFIALLAEAGYTLIPVGVFERGSALCVRFGGPLALPGSAGAAPGDRDSATAARIMRAIAELLPEELR